MSWRRFFHRGEWDAERAREMEAHIEFETAENLARGMAQEEARYAAIRKFGNRTYVREEIYRMNSVGFVEALWQDLRYGLRGLRSNPVFAAVAILSLALGIGANATIFQLFDSVRLRLLPVKDPGQLAEVRIGQQAHYRGSFTGRRPRLTYALWEQIRDNQRAFSGVAAWGDKHFNIAPAGEEHKVEGLFVSGDFFRVLGVDAVLGRVFSGADDQRGCGAAGAVVSYGYWQRELGGDAAAVGRKITLDGHPFSVIGVTARNFFGVDVGHQFDVAVPLCSEPLLEPDRDSADKRDHWWLAAIGRLKPGITMQQASAEMKTLSPAIFRATLPTDFRPEDAKNYLGFQLGAFPAGSGFSSVGEQYANPLVLLLSIAGLVLLIACANLANLMLARASVREREIAVRLALGASRGRLIGQLLSESMLLAVAGAMAGAALAGALSRVLVAFISSAEDQVSLNTAPDWRVFGFTAALAVLTCVLFGLAPALRATRIEPNAAMKAGGRGSTTSRERFGLRRFLVVSQVALSFVLLAGALLFVRSLTHLLTLDAGFRQDGILAIELDMTDRRFSAVRQQMFNRQVLDSLRQVPGVKAAAITAAEPLTDAWWNERVTLQGHGERMQVVNFNRVSDGFFKTLGMRQLGGRDFDEHDTSTSRKVAIVNEAFAREVAGNANPIGKSFKIQANPGMPEPPYEIVGLVNDTKYGSLRDKFGPIVFLPESQNENPEAQSEETDNAPTFLVRSGISLAALTPSIRGTVSHIDRTVPVTYKVLEAEIREGLLPERLMATLSSSFGFLAVALATVGLYGLMAYMVTRRRNEIGVRMALGADQVAVVTMVLREAGILLLAGLVAGLALTLLAGRLANTLLYGVAAWDPFCLVIAVGSLTAIGFTAAFFPAMRAARFNPMAALREE